jgi:GGDEF domain-containing protein
MVPSSDDPSDTKSYYADTVARDSDTLKVKLQEARKTPPCLVIIFGRPLGKQFILEPEDTVIGREPDCKIAFTDKSISKAHAQVSRDDDGHFSIKDLRSTNGTYLNDRKLRPQKPFPLEDGDLVKLGNVIVKFLAGGTIESVFHADMLTLATRDDLTGIFNRKSIMDALDQEYSIAHMTNQPFSIIISDLDNFKSVNDTFGHVSVQRFCRHWTEKYSSARSRTRHLRIAQRDPALSE